MMQSSVRVLVVDDSALMRQMISRFLTEAGMEVVGTAKDGREGLDAVKKLQPDVVTLDVEMPNMDGLAMLRRLMAEHPVPVVMVSSLTLANAPATIEALSLGAVDVVAKPGGTISLNLREVKEELVRKVRIAAGARVLPGSGRPTRVARRASTPSTPSMPSRPSTASSLARTERGQIVIIGSSTGGPKALATLISGLPESFSVPMIIVQHMPAGFTASLAARLNTLNVFDVAEARTGELPQPGQIWVAPGGYHLLFGRGGRMRLDEGPPHLGVRPAVDLTMESAVEVWQGGTIGVVLTGMGMDGARGARRIKQAGGMVLAQDAATSVVYGMPRAVVEMGLADQIVGIEDMAMVLWETVARQVS